MWHNRDNPGVKGGHPFDTCTEQDLCNMITTQEGFEMQFPQSHTKSWGFTPIWPGWPGTGKSYPMTRVSLLHKSDGTSEAPETILKKSGLRLSVINGGWAKETKLLLEPKYDQGFQIAWGEIRDGMLPKACVDVGLKLETMTASKASNAKHSPEVVSEPFHRKTCLDEFPVFTYEPVLTRGKP